MPKLGSTPFQRHKEKWENCTRCPLHEGRNKVVLVRGSLPCTVLFCAEAPGVSEDALGVPLIGPAGKLLDEIIEESENNAGTELRKAFTNIVGCIPLGDDGSKTAEPPPVAIKACAPRLREIIQIAKPRLIVRVGKLADAHVHADDISQVSIVHPAFILRADAAQKGLVIRRTVVILTEAFESL